MANAWQAISCPSSTNLQFTGTGADSQCTNAGSIALNTLPSADSYSLGTTAKVTVFTTNFANCGDFCFEVVSTGTTSTTTTTTTTTTSSPTTTTTTTSPPSTVRNLKIGGTTINQVNVVLDGTSNNNINEVRIVFNGASPVTVFKN
jgi:hypothetical protein